MIAVISAVVAGWSFVGLIVGLKLGHAIRLLLSGTVRYADKQMDDAQ